MVRHVPHADDHDAKERGAKVFIARRMQRGPCSTPQLLEGRFRSPNDALSLPAGRDGPMDGAVDGASPDVRSRTLRKPQLHLSPLPCCKRDLPKVRLLALSLLVALQPRIPALWTTDANVRPIRTLNYSTHHHAKAGALPLVRME